MPLKKEKATLKTRYVVLHKGDLVAVYDYRDEVKEAMELVLEVNSNHISSLKNYTIFELAESVVVSAVYVNPKQLDVVELAHESKSKE